MICSICQHVKRQAIDLAIANGRRLGVVATQFRVNKTDLIKHLKHATTEAILHDHPYNTAHGVESRASVVAHEAETQALTDATLIPAGVRIEGIRISPDQVEDTVICRCYWCSMSDYQRLLRAWEHANRQDKERFCVDTRTMDVPF